MVKQITTDGKGPDKTSITPSTPENPLPCTPNPPKEGILNEPDGVVFLGMKGDHLFFSNVESLDGSDPGNGIYIFNPDGVRFFADARGKLLDYSNQIIVEKDASLTLDYTRFFHAPCSLFGKSKEECWDKVKKDTGLQGSIPQCSLPDDEDYQSKEWQTYLEKVPTVVEYKVVARATGTTFTIQPEPALQKNIYCQPPDSN